MALLAFNKTASLVSFAAGTYTITLPAAVPPDEEGEAFNVTAELKGLPSYAAIAALVAAGTIALRWSEEIEYTTPGLIILLGDTGPQGDPGKDFDEPSPGPDGVLGTADDVYPTHTQFVQFDELADETGGDRAESVFDSEMVPFRLRILSVAGAISRGAKDAQIYLCCHPGGVHAPYSDKFDASQPGRLHETGFVEDRIIEKGEELHAYCSTDYVLGNLVVTYQQLPEEA